MPTGTPGKFDAVEQKGIKNSALPFDNEGVFPGSGNQCGIRNLQGCVKGAVVVSAPGPGNHSI